MSFFPLYIKVEFDHLINFRKKSIIDLMDKHFFIDLLVLLVKVVYFVILIINQKFLEICNKIYFNLFLYKDLCLFFHIVMLLFVYVLLKKIIDQKCQEFVRIYVIKICYQNKHLKYFHSLFFFNLILY
jgi:hypothetical protein